MVKRGLVMLSVPYAAISAFASASAALSSVRLVIEACTKLPKPSHKMTLGQVLDSKSCSGTTQLA
jgi:hypothetical protein